MRKKIVAGNWKMHKTMEEGMVLASEVSNIAADELMPGVELILIPPYVHLYPIFKLIKDQKNITLGAQNCALKEEGAYTGEVSAKMLGSIPVQYCVVGHSERREYFNEDNAMLAEKIDVLLKNKISPIFCCGEKWEVREGGEPIHFVCNQLKESLFHLEAAAIQQVVIAYEPVWAIGTGKTASSEQAQEMHQAIRNYLAAQYGKEIADSIPILYGGSCKPENAKELFAGADIDGGLIGGASLKARDFIEIAKSF